MLIIIYQGTTASDMHYQAYLLEGIARWNSDRGRAMVDGESYRQLNITTPLYPTKLTASVIWSMGKHSMEITEILVNTLVSKFKVLLSIIMTTC
jgi:hypothetical protein